MNDQNKEVITFEVGNFVFDVSVKTPSYIQAGELNQLFKDEIILIIRKNLFELNQRFYPAHSITKKADKLEQQKQNELTNTGTNMDNTNKTTPLSDSKQNNLDSQIIKNDNPIKNAAINTYNTMSSLGQNTLPPIEPKQNATQIINQMANHQNIAPIIKENINNTIIQPNFTTKKIDLSVEDKVLFKNYLSGRV